MAHSFLTKILDRKQEEIAERRQHISEGELLDQAVGQPVPRSLHSALTRASGVAVISEIKKASPSAGVIREDFDPLAIAKSYIAAGAHALSVLTDEDFFQGSLDYITQMRPQVNIPILRKDFIVDPYQIAEARAAGADALLLIVAALEDSELNSLLHRTGELGMQALVEVHDEHEFERALSQGATIVGINNRNLSTFEVDLAVTERVARMAPDNIVLVAESGISTAHDIQRMVNCGAHAMLVGTHFMSQPDPGKSLKSFFDEVAACSA